MVFFPVRSLLKKACNAPLYEKKHSLKLRRYAERLIDLNEYLDSFPRTTMAGEIGVTEINEVLLNSMPNSWAKKLYVNFSSPRCDNVPSGHQRYPLKGLNLGYMYWGQKHSSE